MRSFIGGYGVTIEIDATDLQQKIAICRDALSRKGFERLMNRTFNEVGRRMRTPIAEETVKKYEVTQAWVKSQMLAPRITLGATPTCVVPLKGHKGSIGGRFKARARKAGRVRGKSVAGKIVANIVKGDQSVMPPVMRNQGGNPPFMLYVQKGVQGAKRIKPQGSSKEVAFTRRSSKRMPIVSVKGLAVPQMPLNRAASETQDRILEMAEKRLDHNFQYMFGKG